MKIPTDGNVYVCALNSVFSYLRDEEPLHVLQDLPGVRVHGRCSHFLSFCHGFQSEVFPQRELLLGRVLPLEVLRQVKAEDSRTGPDRRVAESAHRTGERVAVG